jgi:hypothetical protein
MNDESKTNILTAGLSRREWMNRISLPAFGLFTAGMISTDVLASPRQTDENNSSGFRVFNINDFGAKGDGKTLNTLAIQKAIDKCFADNGGTVLIPAGEFLCGTIELMSNVCLHVAAGGKLLGSPGREDYRAGTGVPTSNGNIVFIYAVNAQNITVEGRGIIDGNGAAFYNGKGDNTGPGQGGVGGNFDRPHLFVFYQCTNLLMRNIFLTASAYHCCRILKCRQIHIDGVRIYNRVNKNNDGFHFNDGQYIHIVNCDIQCQDDACALFGSNRFVTITNCTFSTRWSIFRFGSGASQNISISNCLIYDTYGCPIKISAGKASIENFSFSNIVMHNVTGPIGIGFSGGTSNNSSTSVDQPAKPFLRNIVFNGIRATTIKQPVNHPDIPFDVKTYPGEINSCITLNAMGDFFMENISFTDVQVKFAGGGTEAQAAKREIPNVAAEYFGVWDPLPSGPPAYALYARNVKGLTLQNVRFEYNEQDARPAVILDHVTDALINGLSAQGSANSELIRIIDSKDILIVAPRLLTEAKTFLQAEGSSSKNIKVDGGDLSKTKQAVSIQRGAVETSVVYRS